MKRRSRRDSATKTLQASSDIRAIRGSSLNFFLAIPGGNDSLPLEIPQKQEGMHMNRRTTGITRTLNLALVAIVTACAFAGVTAMAEPKPHEPPPPPPKYSPPPPKPACPEVGNWSIGVAVLGFLAIAGLSRNFARKRIGNDPQASA